LCIDRKQFLDLLLPMTGGYLRFGYSKKAADIITALVLVLLGAVLYRTSVPQLVSMWQREDFTYCWFVLPIVIYLIWERRGRLATLPVGRSWLFLAPLGIGIGLYWLGELGGEYTALFLSLWCVAVALCWLHLGWPRLKVIGFPLCFALAMIPPPNFLYSNASLKLKLISSWLGVRMLQLTGMTAYREGNVIDLGFTQLQVVDACSGLRYVIPLLVLGVLIAFHSRLSFWKRVLLVASTIPLSILTNSLRIASVGLLYPVMGVTATEGFFHDFSGWLIFMISLTLLLVEFWALNRFLPEKRRPVRETGNREEIGSSSNGDDGAGKAPGNGSSFLADARFVAAVAILGSTIALSHGVEFRERVPLRRTLVQFPLAVDEWQGTRGALETEVLDTLKLSDYLLVDYRNPGGETINFYVAYHDTQRKGEATHSPSSCLPGSGWVFKESGEVDLPVRQADGSPMRVCRAYMEKSGSRLLTYYWFPQRGRVLTSLHQIKFYNFWDALTRHRTDGALVRVITPVPNSETPEAAEKRLQGIVQLIVPRLAVFLPN
jgi:exosortase D (VPLPA-CTERM-specific)